MFNDFRFSRTGVLSQVLAISALVAILFLSGCTTSGSSEAQLAVATLSGGLPAGSVSVGGGAYPATTLKASGGVAPYVWAVTSGNLPAGLTMNAAGTISGSPTTAGTFNFTVTVTDATTPTGHTATGNLSITINSQLAVKTSGTLPVTGEAGAAYPPTALTNGGGVGPFTWVINSGNLPGGLSLSSLGSISGTISPAAIPGTFNFTAKVTDSQGNSVVSGTLSLTVAPALTIPVTPLPTGVIGTLYTPTTLNATGGTPPYSNWTLTGGTNLPAGLTLSAAGVITGTPTGVGGTTNFTVQVKDAANFTATANFTINVNGSPAITSANNKSFTTGAAGSFTVTTTGFPAPALTETVALPAGVSFKDNGNGTGTLSWTAAVASGSYSLSFTASNGVLPNATQSFTLTVDAVPSITSVNTTSFTSGTAGSFTVTATGFPTPALSETASLPTGVTFTDNKNGTGTLAWTAAVVGGSYALSFTASNGVLPNATQAFTLAVNSAPTITSANSKTFTAGTAGSFTVTTTGFPAPTLSETLALPTGVSFTDNKNGTGTLSWTAAVAAGSYSLSFTASNSVLPNATQSFTLTANAAPAITSANNTSFTVGTAGSFTVTTTGFPIPALSETLALPTGVSFKDNGNGTGTLSWTVAVASGSYGLSFTASNGVLPNAAQAFTLAADSAPAITSSNSTSGKTGTAGSFTVTTTGFPTPALSETLALPTGVSFKDNGNGTGTLSWTAAVAGGSYGLSFTASNTVLPNATQVFTLTVNAAPTITSTNSAGFTVGTAGSFTVTSTGFPTPALSETLALPTGVSFVDNGNGTGTLSWTAAVASGSYGLSFTGSNSVLPNATQAFTLAANSAPAITSSNSTTATAGTAGSFTVTTTGFPAPTLSETVALPAGVTFTDNKNGTGTLSWTAAVASASYVLSFTASNGVLPNATQSFTLTVNSAPAFTSANSTIFTAGVAGSFTVTTKGLPTPALSETLAMPTGVSFKDNSNGTGTLSWTTAVASGSYSLSFTASNGVLPNATQSFTLSVDAPPVITSSNSTTAAAGVAGSFTVTTTGFPTPALSETLALPGGVSFKDNGNGTGTLSWTAAVAGGSYGLSFTASNGVLPNATQSFTLALNAAPVITSANSKTFTTGTAGSFTVTTTGFPTPALSETVALPTGVSFKDNGNGTGTLSWTAAVANGSYGLSFTASNSVLPNATQSFTLTANAAPAITSVNNASFTVGTAGSFTVTTAGFPTPALTETLSLPSGVTFKDNGNGTGTLSWTAAVASGSYGLSFTANNGVLPNATQSFTLAADGAPIITSSNNASGTAGVAGSFTVTTTGFPTPALSETLALPTGVSFHDNGNGTGTLSWTTAVTNGSYSLSFKASNSVLPNATQPFTLNIAVPSCTNNCTLSGTVTAGGQPLGDLTITVTGPSPATTATNAVTASNGSYSFTGLTSGQYTVTAPAGYTYSPSTPLILTINSDLVQNFTATSTIATSTITGTVSYAGTKTGLLYIRVYTSGNCQGNCNGAVAGTSITLTGTPGAYTGSYTVRGLQPVGGGSGGNASGTYNVVAEIDTLNNGSPNASNPNGSTSSPITVNAASVAVPNIPLTDPTPPAPVTPAGVTPAAGSTFVLLQYSQHGNSNLTDNNGREIATSYKVYYDTNPSFTSGTFVTFAAHGAHDNNYIKSNLVTGTTYYFKISTLVGATEGTASSVVSATTAAGTGTFTVSGKVTFSLPAGVPKATGPLYVGLFDQTANKIYAQVIPAASLTSPQAYSVTNVPAGTYQEFAIIDMNNNGLIEPSDISNVSGNQSNPPSVTVAGATTSNLTITSAVSAMDITTSHDQFNGSNDSYNLNLGLAWGSKRPVALTLVSGPNIPVPWDMPIDANNGLQDPNFPNGAIPTVGDTYQFQYTFSDGLTQTIPSQVTAVLNSFAQSMAMQTTSPGSPSVPLLTWVTPSSTPSPYTYYVGLYSVSNGTNVNWNDFGGNNSNGIPSGTTSVLFNADGSANSNGNPISSLPGGTNFQWFVGVQDNNGNTSQETTTYSTSGGSASSPVLTLSYNTPNPIPLNGVTTLVLFINNPNGSSSLSGIAVSDTLPGGLQVVGTGANNNCGGSLVGTGAGSTSVSLTGASLAPGASCQIGFQVTGTITGTTNNTTGPVTSNEAGTGATSNTATLVVGGAGIAPPAIFIFFSPSTMQVNFSTTLNFYISNPNGSTSLSGISFTDALPANLFVLSPNNQLSGSCGGGTITAVAGSQSISLSGGTLGAGGASCSFSVGVTATATGTINDTTSSITSNEGGTGATSNTASLTVNSGSAPSITTGNTADFFVGLQETFDVLASGSPTPAIAVTGALPTGVSFTDNGNGSGVLGGKPGVGTAGGYSPLITASNGVSPNATQTLTLTVTNLTCPLPALGNESLLTGTYVSRFNGFQDANGPSQGVMVFVANGTGGITNGELDLVTALNFSGGSYTTPLAGQRANISASGSCYNLGSDNRGTMVWNLSAGTPITMEFSLRSDGALGHIINFSDVNPSLTGTGSRGSAVFTKRTITGPFSLGNLNGSFAVGLSGFTNDNCVSNTCTGSGDGGYQLLAAVGRFTANGGGGLTGFVFDVAQVNGGGTPAQVNIDLVTPTSASYTAPDTLGRGTLTISGNDARLGGAFTVDYAYYLIDATHFFLQSIDAPINNPLFNGEAIGQSGSFSVASLNGNSVFSMTGGDVATNSFTVTSAGRVTGVGTGSNVSTLLDKISNGSTVSTGTTAITGGTFAVSANGMGSLTIGSGGSAQAFSVAMIGTNSGFIMEGTQASPGTNVMAGLLEAQTTPGGGWTNSAASGLFTEANMFPTVTNAKVEVGSITFTPGSPSGSLSGTSDKSTGPTCANSCLQLNKSISTTYSIDANGRFTLVSSGGSLIGWLRDTTHGTGLSANNIGLTTQFDH